MCVVCPLEVVSAVSCVCICMYVVCVSYGRLPYPVCGMVKHQRGRRGEGATGVLQPRLGVCVCAVTLTAMRGRQASSDPLRFTTHAAVGSRAAGSMIS